MRNVLVTAIFLCLCWISAAAEADGAADANAFSVDGGAKAAIIPCFNMIDEGLYQSIKRRSELALEKGATYLIYEIQTYGGSLQAADSISKYLILDVGKRARTVAYVTTEAISAGAMVSVSCEDIIMLENTTIGDAAPIVMGGKLEGVEREKAESFTRAIMKRAAEANGYPGALLTAMVSIGQEVYRVRNLETGEYEFFEVDDLPTDPNAYALGNRELIDANDEILTLTAERAEEYGVARAVVSDLDEALGFLEGRDGVTFEEGTTTYYTTWSEEMVRWLNSPAVVSVLVLLALLGAYVELNTPGVGLPGLVAVICFTVLVGSKYLIGLANWLEVAIFVLGVILLLVEIFVLPGFGVAGVLGIIFMLMGAFGMLIKNAPEEFPWPRTELDWEIFATGILGISGGVVGFLVVGWLVSRHLPRIGFLSGLSLEPAMAKTGTEFEGQVTAPPEDGRRVLQVGEEGVVTSRLRPAGKAKFGSRVADVVARAEYIEAGGKVRVVEVHGNRVVVERVRGN